MRISLIIAYYKNLPALSLIFKALQNQSYKNFEVILAEDDNDEKTIQFVESRKEELLFPVKHLYQEFDNGFRKNQMLNRAIKTAEGEIIVFLDGDSIPHKHFMKEYDSSIKEGVALFGRRVMLSEDLTSKIMHNQNLELLNILNIMRSGSKRIKYSFYIPFLKSYRETGIWGCNWGILKKHLIDINGFDEDYVKAGVGEDVDIEWRLKQNYIKLQSVRFGAIVYHLHHSVNYTGDDVKFNFALFEEKKEVGNIFCINGLQKKSIN